MPKKMKMKIQICIFLILFLISPSIQDRFIVKNNKIYDSDGGLRIFHGLNVVPKSTAQPTPYSQFEKLKARGFNGIRVDAAWVGVEPKEGQYDDDYLRMLVDYVNEAGKYGIYTLLEFHQDLFSRQFCGNGVPSWLIPQNLNTSFASPLYPNSDLIYDKNGVPDMGKTCHKEPWSKYYQTNSVNQAFQMLYTKKEMLDKFVKYWEKVSEAFKDNQYVIAFELMNQPWPGNARRNPLLFDPYFSHLYLSVVYDKLAAAIRTIDPNRNICFEPVTWWNGLNPGFSHPPGGNAFSNLSIFCFHQYHPPVVTTVEQYHSSIDKTAKRISSASLLSEFFITGEKTQKSREIMDSCDKYSTSWFGWNYGANLPIIPEAERTFAHRIAGDIIEQSYSEETKEYRLLFFANPSAGKTKIFFGKNNYKMIEIETSPSIMTFERVEGIYLEFDSRQFEKGERVMVIIHKSQ